MHYSNNRIIDFLTVALVGLDFPLLLLHEPRYSGDVTTPMYHGAQSGHIYSLPPSTTTSFLSLYQFIESLSQSLSQLSLFPETNFRSPNGAQSE